MLVDESTNLAWDEPPFCLLSPEQQGQVKNQAQTRRYKLGEKIWSTETTGNQFLIVSGKVRLREEVGAGLPEISVGQSKLVDQPAPTKPLATLEVLDWFGDLLELPYSVKAVAASNWSLD